MYLHLLRKNICVLPFLFSAASLKGQINESDSARFQLRAGITGNFQKGNVEVLTIKSRIDFTYAPIKDFVIKSQNSSLYQSFYSKEADNDIFSRNYFYYKPKDMIYPFGIAYIATNFRRKIDKRLFAGAGVTGHLLNKALHVIKISASAMYETTRFKALNYNYSNYDGNDEVNVWRGTIYLGGWNYLSDKHLRFYYDAYWQFGFNDKNNYRTQLDAGLDIPVWRGVAFNAIYSFAHENITILNIQQDDKILTFGLSYNLKIKHQ
ncbi:MAG: DUF481 domain-containing protein [Ferruginibacter sp.]|nr:DUF481 domain-containing protein [Ferruginibacter sp.]